MLKYLRSYDPEFSPWKPGDAYSTEDEPWAPFLPAFSQDQVTYVQFSGVVQ